MPQEALTQDGFNPIKRPYWPGIKSPAEVYALVARPVQFPLGQYTQTHPTGQAYAERLCREIQQDLPNRGAGLLRLRFTAGGQADD